MNDLMAAETWFDGHRALHKYGLSIKPHGNGLVLRDLRGKNSIKASDLDRSLSKGQLEKRFGKFKAPDFDSEQAPAPEFTYAAKPLQHGAVWDDLYAEYCRAMKERRSEMEKVKERETVLYKDHRQEWNGKWEAIRKLPMLRAHWQQVMKEFEVRKKTELAALRGRIKAERSLIRERYPFTSWNKFLQHKAGQGNEAALAVLRSRKTKVQAQPKAENTSNLDKNLLVAVAQMRDMLKNEATPFQKAPPLKYHIDGKGVIIFSLPDGGMIRDHGEEIHFSANNQKAAELAAKLAKVRWGQNVTVDNHVFKLELVDMPVQTYQPEQSNGYEL